MKKGKQCGQFIAEYGDGRTVTIVWGVNLFEFSDGSAREGGRWFETDNGILVKRESEGMYRLSGEGLTTNDPNEPKHST